MKPVDMKMKKSEMTTAAPAAEKASGPRYPWGLEIRLDNAAIEKLGMTDLPEVGTECRIIGVGRVTSVSQSERQEGKHRDVSIQIEKLALHHDSDEEMEKAFTKGFKRGPKRRGY